MIYRRKTISRHVDSSCVAKLERHCDNIIIIIVSHEISLSAPFQNLGLCALTLLSTIASSRMSSIPIPLGFNGSGLPLD
jgi:hypothetical protein